MPEDLAFDEANEEIERLTAERDELCEALEVRGFADTAADIRAKHAAIPREFDFGTYKPEPASSEIEASDAYLRKSPKLAAILDQAADPSTPVEKLKKLQSNPAHRVRAVVASNPSATEGMLLQALEDQNAEVRMAASQAMESSYDG